MNELVLREDITPEVRSHSEDIQNAGVSLLSIVNDILDFSTRILYRYFQTRFTVFDMRQLYRKSYFSFFCIYSR